MIDKETHSLVLSGGGAKGAFQAGVIHGLEISPQTVDHVSGVSVGNLNGAMLASGQVDAMREVWREISPDKVLKKRSVIKLAVSYGLHKIGIGKPPLGYYNNDPLRELIHEHLFHEHLKVHFTSGVVDIETGEYFDYRINPGERITEGMVDHILASTAIPVIFDPVQTDDYLLVDGGLRQQSPIGSGLSINPDKVTIITCGNPNTTFDKRVADIVDVAQNTISTLTAEVFTKDIREFIRINTLVSRVEAGIQRVLAGTVTGEFARDNELKRTDEQALREMFLEKPDGGLYQYYPFRIITPPESLGDSLDFSRKQARRNFDMGVEVGKDFLQREDQGFVR